MFTYYNRVTLIMFLQTLCNTYLPLYDRCLSSVQDVHIICIDSIHLGVDLFFTGSVFSEISSSDNMFQISRCCRNDLHCTMRCLLCCCAHAHTCTKPPHESTLVIHGWLLCRCYFTLLLLSQ